MKKKPIAATLLIAGIILLGLSIILAIISTLQKDIIGGADLPTFFFVFSREYGGLYSILALLGAVVAVTAILMITLRRKK